MFILQLAIKPVIEGRPPNIGIVARGTSRLELMLFVAQHITPDGNLSGPLSTYETPVGDEIVQGTPAILDVGTADEWAKMARKDFENRVMSLPTPSANRFHAADGGMLMPPGSTCWREATPCSDKEKFKRVRMCTVCKAAVGRLAS